MTWLRRFLLLSVAACAAVACRSLRADSAPGLSASNDTQRSITSGKAGGIKSAGYRAEALALQATETIDSYEVPGEEVRIGNEQGGFSPRLVKDSRGTLFLVWSGGFRRHFSSQAPTDIYMASIDKGARSSIKPVVKSIAGLACLHDVQAGPDDALSLLWSDFAYDVCGSLLVSSETLCMKEDSAQIYYGRVRDGTVLERVPILDDEARLTSADFAIAQFSAPIPMLRLGNHGTAFVFWKDQRECSPRERETLCESPQFRAYDVSTGTMSPVAPISQRGRDVVWDLAVASGPDGTVHASWNKSHGIYFQTIAGPVHEGIEVAVGFKSAHWTLKHYYSTSMVVDGKGRPTLAVVGGFYVDGWYKDALVIARKHDGEWRNALWTLPPEFEYWTMHGSVRVLADEGSDDIHVLYQVAEKHSDAHVKAASFLEKDEWDANRPLLYAKLSGEELSSFQVVASNTKPSKFDMALDRSGDLHLVWVDREDARYRLRHAYLPSTHHPAQTP